MLRELEWWLRRGSHPGDDAAFQQAAALLLAAAFDIEDFPERFRSAARTMPGVPRTLGKRRQAQKLGELDSAH
jgi:hypothetical protein